MDTSIRPKPSNHHKPRIRMGTIMGLWPQHSILLPKYICQKRHDGSIVMRPNGHIKAGETGSLPKAIQAAVEWKREHMPWVPA